MQHRYFLAATVALAACQGTADTIAPSGQAVAARSAAHHHENPGLPYTQLPVEELARVRRATARYTDVRNATADGYVDIGVEIEHMGSHFLKDSLMDARFDAERPELLVYSTDGHGHRNLVAVEYAVPLNLSSLAPEGFVGPDDVWFEDQRFKLWTLHAWVWRENPAGVFNPTNSRVP